MAQQPPRYVILNNPRDTSSSPTPLIRRARWAAPARPGAGRRTGGLELGLARGGKLGQARLGMSSPRCLGHRAGERRPRDVYAALDLDLGLESSPAPSQNDRADGRDQQQERGDLEREQIRGQ